MILDLLIQQVLVAVLGGCAAELLHWYMLARKPGGVAKFSTQPAYWATTGLMIALGGLMPVLYIQGSASAPLCFHLGAATPVVIQKLVAAQPTLVTRQGGGGASLRDFFTW